jgi:hypothetical protein
MNRSPAEPRFDKLRSGRLAAILDESRIYLGGDSRVGVTGERRGLSH